MDSDERLFVCDRSSDLTGGARCVQPSEALDRMRLTRLRQLHETAKRLLGSDLRDALEP